MTSFFSELKRRNVVRVAAAYVIVGWLVVQIAETSPLPEKTLRARDAVVVHVSPPIGLQMFGDEPLRSRDRALWRKMKDWDMTGHCAFTSYVLLRGRNSCALCSDSSARRVLSSACATRSATAFSIC